jgi:thymidylate synthase
MNEHVYLELLEDILENGEVREDRTGVGTISVFGRQLRFDLEKGFPAVTTKKLAWKACKSELIWFLEGSGDERRLAKILHGTKDPANTTIWSGNATAPYWEPKAKFPGDLGRVYGVQWRNWGGVDQIKNLIDGISKDPYSRRHIVSAWNVDELDDMALPPCHVMSQFSVSNNGRLSCHMYQRSCDVFLGIPFNIASYALLTHMIAQVCGLRVGELVISTGDTHIYLNHREQVEEQLTRRPYPAPTLWLNTDITEINGFGMDDIQLTNYESHASIKAEMAV